MTKGFEATEVQNLGFMTLILVGGVGVANPDADVDHPVHPSPVHHRAPPACLRRPSEQVHHLAFSNEFKFLCPELAEASIRKQAPSSGFIMQIRRSNHHPLRTLLLRPGIAEQRIPTFCQCKFV